jgi:hypothetical protein
LAEIEVTLKSGASLVGKVKIDGAEAVVTVGDSDLRVPLAEVDSITSIDAGPERQARQLLLSALEARLSKDGATEVVGLLAEASRLAPDDPNVAYWYANSLAEGGYGQAASDVLTKKRELIAKAYPGLVDQLAERIKKRVDMERMPPALVERLDTLNATIGKQPENAEQRQMAAVFSIVDQDGAPIDRADFDLQCNGQDANVEAFDDGYYLYTFNRHRNNNDEPFYLDVTRHGLESKVFDITASSNRVKDAGKLVVKRYGDDEKRPFHVAVANAKGEPVIGAQVSLQAMSSRGNMSNQTLTGETNGEGKAEIPAFPGKYHYRVNLQGYNAVSGNRELASNATDADELKLEIYPSILATVRLAWQSAMPQGGGSTTGESTLDVGSGVQPQNVYGQDPAPWLRAVQVKDRLTLQFIDSPYGFQGPFGGESWVRVAGSKADLEDGAASNAKAPTSDSPEAPPAEADPNAKPGPQAEATLGLEEFNDLNLDDIDDLKDKLKRPRNLGGGEQRGPRPPVVLAAETGKIYVGQLQHRDMRSGQPVQLSYKVFVEELTKDGDE